jgi:hypothetical protein
MKTRNATPQTTQAKLGCFVVLPLVDFRLAACGEHSQYFKVQLACSPRRRTEIQLSYVSSLANILNPICILSTNHYQLFTQFLNTNIILLSHSFGGLSPPKAVR